ncbi:MAG: hypothetical protein QOG28_4648, partial [Trebonia sp.]|nr:hypothetical protein [Trebonia sp.]
CSSGTSPATGLSVPRTVMAPQKCLTRNSAIDPAGSSTQAAGGKPVSQLGRGTRCRGRLRDA